MSFLSRKDLEKLLELGEKGNKMLLKAQREALGEIADEIFRCWLWQWCSK